ncbi:MAG: hypothetical protein HYV14_01045 [Elusimicrobia bacterium]|nr:hypothetical protein [Elusimicrobiota bacterium]
MKTPRALLAALLALTASAARAGDPTIIFPQNNRGVTDFSRLQNAADWKILHIERNPSDVSLIRLAPRGATKGDPITVVNPYDEYFIVPAGSVLFGGMATVLSVSKDPYPGAMRGEPVRLLGPGGQPTGPQLWMPSRNSADITDQLRYWPTLPADNTRVDRSRVIVLPRERSLADNGLQSGGLPNWFTLPGQKPRDVLSPLLGGQDLSSTLLGFPGGTPPTYYTALTNYRYDERNKKLIGPDGAAKTVTVMAMPAGTFYLAPPAIPHDIRIPGVTLVNSSGAKVDPKKGAQPPKSDGIKREFKKTAWAGNWKDKVTHIHRWHAVETTQAPIPMAPTPMMTFYCYHEAEDGHKNISGHLKSNYDVVECVDWIVPADDKVEKADGKEYRVRNNRVVIDVVYKDHALRRVDAGGANLVLKDKPLSHAAIGGQDWVKVTAAKAPDAPAAASLALIAETETRWLTKVQAAAYAAARKDAKDDAARKALDDKYRALLEAQIRPEALAGYKAARALPAAQAEAKIKDAIGKTEMWGGKDAKDVKAVIAPFQETASPDTAKMLEIQLSKADWDLLTKKGDDLLRYNQARHGADGVATQGTGFAPANVDPVALRLAVTAARAAVGSAEGKPPVATTPEKPPRSILTPEEIALLTPKEKEMYDGYLKRATKDGKLDPTENNLLTNAELLRNRMNNEVPPRSKVPAAPASDDMTAEQFAKLPLFQQRQFCKDYPPDPATIQGDTRAPVIDTDNPDALKGAQNSVPDAVPQTKPAESNTQTRDTKWPRKARQDACKNLPDEIPGRIDGTAGTGGKPAVGANVPVPTGSDVENKEKEKSKWLTSDLLTSAAKGAMVGLLVGSLFGPAGLVLGPLLGGALFYGLTKITS